MNEMEKLYIRDRRHYARFLTSWLELLHDMHHSVDVSNSQNALAGSPCCSRVAVGAASAGFAGGFRSASALRS